MSDVTVNCRENGPLLISGGATILDSAGNTYDTAGKETIALCRCGASKNSPLCDGSHRDAGFKVCNNVPTAE